MRLLKIFTYINLTFFFCILLFCSRAEAFSLEIKPGVAYIYSDTPAEVRVPLTLKNPSDDRQEIRFSFLQIDPDASVNNTLSYTTKTTDSHKELFENIEIQENGQKFESISITAHEEKKVEAVILIESKHAKKDYYFSISFQDSSTIPVSEKSSSIIRSGIALPIFLSTNYKSPILATIEEFSTFPVVLNKPVIFRVLINNNSEHFITAKGYLEISNMFGKDVAKLEIPEQAILSTSKRYIGTYLSSNKSYNSNINQPFLAWDENFMLGLYKTTLNLEISGDKNKLEKTIWFLALPVKELIILIIILGIIISIYLRVIYKLRSSKPS